MRVTQSRSSVFTAVSGWLAILIIAGGLALPLAAQEKDVITWGILDHPPTHILEGPNVGTGVGDLQINFMIDHLGQYDHQIEIFPNYSRLSADINADRHVCSAGYYYVPPGHVRRESWATSAPHSLALDRHLIVRKGDRHLYGDEVSFEEVFTNKELIFGHISGHTYAPEIMTILSRAMGVDNLHALTPEERLEAFDRLPNVYRRTGVDMQEGILKMLAAGRVGYLLLSPSPMVYLSEVLGLQDQFAMIPLKETPRMGLFAFICPNTEWGHQVIDDINGVLKTARSTPEYRKLLKWYVVPKEQEEEYWKLYEEQVLSVLE